MTRPPILSATPNAPQGRRRLLYRVGVPALLVSLAVLAGCSSGGSSTHAASTTTTPAAATASTPPTAHAAALHINDEWDAVTPGGDCDCADGSKYSFWVHPGDPKKVAVILQGGGACFDASTCTFVEGPYKPRIFQEDDPTDGDGLLDVNDSRNPIGDWSIVFAPYCTGDLFLGSTVQKDAPDQVVHHKGFNDGSAVLDEVAKRFPGANKILVAGESAGGAAAPLYGGLASDRFPKASITVLADGAGAYPDSPAINEMAGKRWGSQAAVPNWNSTRGLTLADFGLPRLFVLAGKHDPSITFGRTDFDQDEVQVYYAQLAGLGNNVLGQITTNGRSIRDAGVKVANYVSTGNHHTILTTPYLWDHKVDGVRMTDWITDLLNGTAKDVNCKDCG